MGTNKNRKKYYDGTKLLSLKDLNGNQPEIYLLDGNRTGGKTTYFNRLMINQYKKNDEVFGYLVRKQNEVKNCSESFFAQIKEMYFPDDELTEETFSRGIYSEWYLNENLCAYVIPLTAANFVKKHSHLFSRCAKLYFDEFQPEDNSYLPDEIDKFFSIHTSLARGIDKQVKFLPVYMISNSVTMLNPYYSALGISTRLRADTKYLRGNGFVMEHNYNPHSAKAIKESSFNQAFSSSKQLEYASENIYLHDNLNFIETVSGLNRYLCTIRYKGKIFSIKEYQSQGIVYVDTSYDLQFPVKLTLSASEHDINYIMIANNIDFIQKMRWYFTHGAFRFKNLDCKEMLLKMISY